MYLPHSQEESLHWICKYDEQQKNDVVTEYYKIKNGEKVALPIREGQPECKKFEQ